LLGKAGQPDTARVPAASRDLTWLPFAAGATVAAVGLVLAVTLGSTTTPPPGGSTTPRAAVVAFVHARPGSDVKICPDQRGANAGGGAGWVSFNDFSTSDPVRTQVDRDGAHATVALPDGGHFRLRIQHVAGRYYACPRS
jgi:hypothetical protein